MGGPTRSRSRSTTVVASVAAAGLRKAKNKRKGGGVAAQPATWDHDNSSGSDADHDAHAKATTQDAPRAQQGKKDKGSLGKNSSASDELPEQNVHDQESRKRRKGAPKRRRSSTGGGDEESDKPAAISDKEDSEGSEQSEDRDDELSAEDGTGNVAVAGGGGMGDVMARILGQKVDTRTQAPVLAKRKTKVMKEMEEASAKRAESKGKSAARRANMTQQFVIPDHTTTDYERQLKKIATRGVVALFNAISKRQKQGVTEDDGSGKTRRTAKAAAVKGASRHVFLDMLKSGVKPAAGSLTAGVTGGVGGGGGAGAVGRGGAAWNKDSVDGAEGGRSWSVLKEDYMLGASSMKNWDQESAESEPDALAGGSAMSDDSD